MSGRRNIIQSLLLSNCVQAANAPASLVVTQHDDVAAGQAAVPVQVRIEGAGQVRLKVGHQPRRCALPAHTSKPKVGSLLCIRSNG